jgi:hypothetical protein
MAMMASDIAKTEILALLVVQTLAAAIGNLTAINRSMDIAVKKRPEVAPLVHNIKI